MAVIPSFGDMLGSIKVTFKGLSKIVGGVNFFNGILTYVDYTITALNTGKNALISFFKGSLSPLIKQALDDGLKSVTPQLIDISKQFQSVGSFFMACKTGGMELDNIDKDDKDDKNDKDGENGENMEDGEKDGEAKKNTIENETTALEETEIKLQTETNEDSTFSDSKKFSCEDCHRTFVRERGLIHHRENDCSAKKIKEESNRQKNNDENKNIAESSDDEEEIFTETIQGDEEGNNMYNESYDDQDQDNQQQRKKNELPPNMELTARSLLNMIIRKLKTEDKNMTLEQIWEKLAMGESYLSIEDFQTKVFEVAKFRPSNDATSSLWLLLDDDRNGWLEKNEFLGFARNNSSSDIQEIDESLVIEEDEDELPTHIESSGLDGWTLLISTWYSSEPKIRKTVQDFGGHDEKINLVLLDELVIEREDIDQAWQAFRSLSTFLERME